MSTVTNEQFLYAIIKQLEGKVSAKRSAPKQSD